MRRQDIAIHEASIQLYNLYAERFPACYRIQKLETYPGTIYGLIDPIKSESFEQLWEELSPERSQIKNLHVPGSGNKRKSKALYRQATPEYIVRVLEMAEDANALDIDLGFNESLYFRKVGDVILCARAFIGKGNNGRYKVVNRSGMRVTDNRVVHAIYPLGTSFR